MGVEKEKMGSLESKVDWGLLANVVPLVLEGLKGKRVSLENVELWETEGPLEKREIRGLLEDKE